jgi:hypothetical protein
MGRIDQAVKIFKNISFVTRLTQYTQKHFILYLSQIDLNYFCAISAMPTDQ